MTIKGREKLVPLGIHTSVGVLHEIDRWKDIPYLDRNSGLLPPFILHVGDRRRVLRAPETLGLRNPVFIDQVAAERVSLDASGRVAMLIGELERDGFVLPLAVVETQMGCPAIQINLHEMMFHAADNQYINSGGRSIRSNGIYSVRVGTCAGVNSFEPEKQKIEIGDVLVSTDTFASSGAIIQSSLGILGFTGVCIADNFDPSLERSHGLRLSHDRKHLVTRSSEIVRLALEVAARESKTRYTSGPNFAKDSLYAEMSERIFAMLRDTYGVVSTEMEAIVSDSLAARFTHSGVQVFSGCVLAAVGAIPGKSFPETAAEKESAASAITNAMRIAADALFNIAKALNP